MIQRWHSLILSMFAAEYTTKPKLNLNALYTYEHHPQTICRWNIRYAPTSYQYKCVIGWLHFATCCEKCQAPTSSRQKMSIKAAKFPARLTHLPRRDRGLRIPHRLNMTRIAISLIYVGQQNWWHLCAARRPNVLLT